MYGFLSKFSRFVGVCLMYVVVVVASASSMVNGNSFWLLMDLFVVCGVKGDFGVVLLFVLFMCCVKLEMLLGECGYTSMTSRIDVSRFEFGD